MWREHYRQMIATVFVDHEPQHDLTHATGRIQTLAGKIVRRMEHQLVLAAGAVIGNFQFLRNPSLLVGENIEYRDPQITVDTTEHAANSRGMCAAQRIENMGGKVRHGYSIDALSRLLVVASTIGLM